MKRVKSPNPNVFANYPLNRAGNERRSAEWVTAQQTHPDAQMIIISGQNPLIVRDSPLSRLSWLMLEALSLLPVQKDLVLLGLEGSAPRFAVDVTGHEDVFEGLGEFADLRKSAPYMSADDLAIIGHAMWLLNWHERHQRCPQSGETTVMADGGYKRVNPSSGVEQYPRINPVAIVLPTFGEKVCLGRGPDFPPGFLSAFAGYLEPGETLEECAIRELHEEAGLKATDAEYIFSQPWPFSASLMVGFIAPVESLELTLDPEEIAEARWCSREEIRDALQGHHDHGFFVPPPYTIAHQLLKVWVAR